MRAAARMGRHPRHLGRSAGGISRSPPGGGPEVLAGEEGGIPSNPSQVVAWVRQVVHATASNISTAASRPSYYWH